MKKVLDLELKERDVNNESRLRAEQVP